MRRLAIVLFACGLLTPAALAQTPVDVPTVNHSVAITTGNTYQTVLAATSSSTDYNRKSVTIQNNNTNSDNCWIEISGLISAGMTTASTVTPLGGSSMTTVKASILLSPGGSWQRYFPYVPSGAVVATCAGSGDSLYVDAQ